MGAVSPRPIDAKAMSPKSSPAASSQITKLSISKNYVIPPRPKPGRKPSNDVPPSRRKAQNRDAQRAFRERKSQAVKVLEAQLAKQAQEFEKQQSFMRDQIAQLQKQNMKLQTSPSASPATITLSSVSPFQGTPYGTAPAGSPQPFSQQSSPPGMVMLSPIQFQTLGSPQPAISQAPSPQHIATPQSPGSPFGTPVTPADVAGLELLDHVLEQKLPVQPSSPTSPAKMSRRLSRTATKLSPEAIQSSGVVRTDPPMTSKPLDLINTDWSQPAVPLRRRSTALEVDFTSLFSPNTPRPLTLPSPPALNDRCGFCTDNTPCICAAAAAREEGNDLAPDLTTLGSPLGDAATLPTADEQTRRLSQSDKSLSNNADSPSPLDDSQGDCTSNPGNCSKCRQDPMLTLFCSAVASKPTAARLPPMGTFIPAQAAYKTLSRHPRFGHADLGEIVSVLLVKSLQIEVNSVAKVLRILDTK